LADNAGREVFKSTRSKIKMPEILLLHTPKFNNYYKPIGSFSFIQYPPIGLLGLADHLRKNGRTSEVIHLGVELRQYGSIDLRRIIAETQPAIIGLDLHWHFQAFDVIEIAQEIRQAAPEIPILFGGFTASLFAEEILSSYDCVDFIIRGDAETPLLELVTHVCSDREYDAVPNLAFRRENVIRLNPLTYVADQEKLDSLSYTDFTFMKDYPVFVESFSRSTTIGGLSDATQRILLGWKKTYPVVLGRGCVHQCSFCGGSAPAQAAINNRKQVCARSVDSVLGSIVDIQRFGFDSIYFAEDPFPC
jgi:radical SAM superfamily enzyme YgiQ (UPF0313 family)